MWKTIVGSNCTKAIEILLRGIERLFERCKSEENDEETEGKGERGEKKRTRLFVRTNNNPSGVVFRGTVGISRTGIVSSLACLTTVWLLKLVR